MTLSTPAPARQRWRLIVSLPAPVAPDRAAPVAAGGGWSELLSAAGLPLAGEGAARGRVVVAAPLPLGVAGEREVLDLYLAERLSATVVRAAVARALPGDTVLVDLHDVWVGAPSAPAVVIAADYRALLGGPPRWRVEDAVTALLDATSLPRERRREKKTTSLDLRPLILGLQVRSSDGRGVTLAMRLRHRPDAVGRPEDVVAALGEQPALRDEAPTVRSIVRERLMLADEAAVPFG